MIYLAVGSLAVLLFIYKWIPPYDYGYKEGVKASAKLQAQLFPTSETRVSSPDSYYVQHESDCDCTTCTPTHLN